MPAVGTGLRQKSGQEKEDWIGSESGHVPGGGAQALFSDQPVWGAEIEERTRDVSTEKGDPPRPSPPSEDIRATVSPAKSVLSPNAREQNSKDLPPKTVQPARVHA